MKDEITIDDNKKLAYAEDMLMQILSIGSRDLEEIYRMEQNHPSTIDRAMQDEKEVYGLNFGLFVESVKLVALSEVVDIITEKDADSFTDMIIDDNYSAWGGIVDYGYYDGKDVDGNIDRQDLFADYVAGDITKQEFITEYDKILKATTDEEVGKNDETENN